MKILLIGGSGFVGRHLACRLTAAGHRVTVPTRRRARALALTVNPTLDLVAADVNDKEMLRQLLVGQDAVVNLVGILRGDFQRVHAEWPAQLAWAALAAGVPRLIHVSALGAAADAPSAYLRSKAAGEAALRAVTESPTAGVSLKVTVFRPSVIFGRGDRFLNLFTELLAVAPLVPLACPGAEFQPVWVEDVAMALATSLERPGDRFQLYELGGPRTYTLRQLVQYAGRISGHPRPLLGLSNGLSWLQAALMECIPGGPMTRDNWRSMQVPNVCAPGYQFPFAIRPSALEAIAPGYLGNRAGVGR